MYELLYTCLGMESYWSSYGTRADAEAVGEELLEGLAVESYRVVYKR